MTATTDLQELTGRASLRAVSAKQWSRLVSNALEKDGSSSDGSGRVVASLLHHIVRPRSPALLVAYLSQGLTDGLFTARDFALGLLAHLHNAESTPAVSTTALSSIATALLTTPTGLDPSEPFPSPIAVSEIPDVGTSASALQDEIPALTLVLPLLRQCAAGPVPPNLVSLAGQLTALIPQLPAPPFEAGLEAAQLSGVLPEEIARPLRECLAGLMADLPMPAAAPAQEQAMFENSLQLGVGANGYGDLGGAPLPLSPLRATSLPLHQMTAYLLEYSERAMGWAKSVPHQSDPPTPPHHQMTIIRIGKALTADPQSYLSALLDSALSRMFKPSQSPSAATRSYVFFVEEFPVLLRWWMDNSESKWSFPPNLQSALQNVFSSRSQELANWFQNVTSTYSAKSSQMDIEDEAGPYMQPDGWSVLTLEATAVRRYVLLGLLDEDAASTILGSPFRPTPGGPSLLDRLGNCSQQHLDALIYFTTYAAGSSRGLGAEVAKCVTEAPHSQPPDGLFMRLASSPELLALVTGYITPSSLLELVTTHVLNHDEEHASRMEDPQSSLIRFGEGVILAEAICAQFHLPLPDLLYDSRRAACLSDLTTQEQSHMNGWVKALFGSDGIDDEIIMATSSQGLCRLATTLVQQAVIAAMAGQIDLDTLHSGLSYFAQPLLSWCLGGVVGWLCAEIERQGILSGVHLNVLQTLVLDTAFPEPLLRANAEKVNRLLESSAGLEAVFETSNFDAANVAGRLQAVGGPDGGPLPQSVQTAALPTLRAELQAVRHLDLAAQGWEARMLDALEGSLRSNSPLTVLEGVMNDVFFSNMDLQSDLLVHFLGIMCVLDMPKVTPSLATALVDGFLPSLCTARSPFVLPPPMPAPTLLSSTVPPPHAPAPPEPHSAQALYRVLKAVLLAQSSLDESAGDLLASHISEEIAVQSNRRRLGSQPKKVARASHHFEPPLTVEQGKLVCTLRASFEMDDELRARWPALAPLATM